MGSLREPPRFSEAGPTARSSRLGRGGIFRRADVATSCLLDIRKELQMRKITAVCASLLLLTLEVGAGCQRADAQQAGGRAPAAGAASTPGAGATPGSGQPGNSNP